MAVAVAVEIAATAEAATATNHWRHFSADNSSVSSADPRPIRGFVVWGVCFLPISPDAKSPKPEAEGRYSANCEAGGAAQV